MAGPTSKTAWTNAERDVASDLAEAFGRNFKRNALSGANNRRDDGTPRPGDVAIPPDLDMLIEVKYRASHAHHTLHKDAVADATKHGYTPEHAFLITKVKRERDYLVTMHRSMFKKMLAVPGVQDLLRRSD